MPKMVYFVFNSLPIEFFFEMHFDFCVLHFVKT